MTTLAIDGTTTTVRCLVDSGAAKCVGSKEQLRKLLGHKAFHDALSVDYSKPPFRYLAHT